MGLVRFTVKASLVGGIIYYTVQEGLWSKHDESLKLYGKINNTVTPYVTGNVPKEIIDGIPPIPSLSGLKYWMATTWNAGVIKSMKFIVDSPSKISELCESAFKLAENSTAKLAKSE